MAKLDFNEVAELWIMHTAKGTFEIGFKAGEAPVFPEKKPVWVTKYKTYWDKPTNPVTIEFTLRSDSYIQEAIDFLYNNNESLDSNHE